MAVTWNSSIFPRLTSTCTNIKVAEAGLERVRELLGEMLISAEGGAKSDAIRAASEHVEAAIDLLSADQYSKS